MTSARSTPFPLPRTATFGREAAVQSVLTALGRGDPIITLTGLGGVGKTRLAIVSARAALARGAVAELAWCDASACESLAELAFAVAAAITGPAPSLRRGRGRKRAFDLVIDAIAGVGLTRLVVLDGLEHLAPSAGPELARLTAAVPEVHLLVTSRLALRLANETQIPVRPLEVGPGSPAVAMLRERARVSVDSAWHRDDAALERLALGLDGIPLAIELAAARASLVSPDELASALTTDALGLAGEPAARASREAAVTWSWDRLAPDEREAAAALAWIDGPFDLELAELAIGRPRNEVVRLLESLVHVSLLEGESPRLDFLDTVREHLRRRLEPARRDAVRDAFTSRLLAVVARHEHGLYRVLDPQGAARVAVAREVYLGIVRRGLDPAATPERLGYALTAVVHLLPELRRNAFGHAVLEPALALFEHPRLDTVPLEARLDAALAAMSVAVTSELDGVPERLLALVRRWSVALTDPRRALAAALAEGLWLYHGWRFAELLALTDEALASPVVADDIDLQLLSLVANIAARRALGLADRERDGRRFAGLAARLADVPLFAATIAYHQAALALATGDPDAARRFADAGLARAVAARLPRAMAMNLRELAKIDADVGRLAASLTRYDQVLTVLSATLHVRERQETLLDRALTALEAGRYELVRASLDAASDALANDFELAFSAALGHALALLEGRADPAPEVPRTGTVEDAAIDLLIHLGAPGTDPPPPIASPRWRAARRIQRAFVSLHAPSGGPPAALGVALDGRAFRVAVAWVLFGDKHLLRTLFDLLARRAIDERGQGLEVDALCRLLWPDERVAREFLERRLQVAVSALRKLGVGAVLEFDAGTYRLDPRVTVLRLAESAVAGGALRSR